MAAYIVVDVDVKDPGGYEEYRKLVKPTLDAYGGKFLVRGGKAETLEGSWTPNRMVILEFDSVERAKQWWGSREYEPAKRLRQKYAATEMIVIEGA